MHGFVEVEMAQRMKEEEKEWGPSGTTVYVAPEKIVSIRGVLKGCSEMIFEDHYSIVVVGEPTALVKQFGAVPRRVVL